MASSSNSSVNSQPNYLEVYKCWLRDNSRPNGDSPIPINEILIRLRHSQLWSTQQRQLVEGERTDMNKLSMLFTEIMPAKGEAGFNQVVEILRANNSEQLANDLMAKCYGPEESRTRSIPTPSSTFKVQAQVHLSRLIKENVDFMSQYWSDIIPIAETYEAFVEVQMVKDFKSTSGIPVNKIQDVFDKDEQKTIYKRIVIQGDPGCGKTTYVNKLALDWADQDEYLRSKFDFVFLIELKELAMSVDDTIKTFLPEESKRFFKFYAESAESKILLILDGFDELQETSKWYQDVMNLLEGKSFQFKFFNILLTSRRSHIDQIPNKVRGQCLLIKGFNEQSMKQFLSKQHVPLPSVGQESNLSRLLQTPLFCAIYCSLYFGGGERIELEDSYDLIKALVENSVRNTVKKKTVANVEEQLDEIGKFAFEMLDSESLNILKNFCRSSEVIKPSFDLSRVNLDLLIKRAISTRGVDRFQEEFSLPHQLIAEYLAARYFARSLTEEQLKQADASALIPDFYNCVVLDLPFVRFFLFELLFLYLEKKYEESVFDNFIDIPLLRFIWNIKSNKDIPSLDNVSHLYFYRSNSELTNVSRFIPTLSKCRHLSLLSLDTNVGSTPQLFTALSKCKHLQVLDLSRCKLSVEPTTELARCIDNHGLANLTKLDLYWNANVGSTPQLFTALSKCKHLQVLELRRCEMTVESTTELARCIDNNGLANLTKLYLEGNANVGSTLQLFTALSKCKHLQVLHLQLCEMTVESTAELARCIDNNGLDNLTKLYLYPNENVGSTLQLFTALSKCKHLQVLELRRCEMTIESTTELARCIDNNGLASLTKLYLEGNANVGSTPQLFTALSKCKHLKELHLQLCEMTNESTTELARCIDNNGLTNLTKLYSEGNANVGSTPELFTALSKCKHLQVLHLQLCEMTVESTTELARCINNNGLANLTKLYSEENENVGSTPQLFTALSKCKHLQVLHLQLCEMTVESTTELARCIDNNGLASLTKLYLEGNANVGSSTDLFHVLHKCSQLQWLYLVRCSMRQESLNILLSTFNSNTFQQLDHIWLYDNEEIKVDDNFFIVLEKCLKISKVYLDDDVESDLSEVGRKAKETLKQRGCKFKFY